MKIIKNTILDLINQAEKQGLKIEYVKRKDGGVRIKSINGQKYVNSEGNNALRALMNQPMSEKTKVQRVTNLAKIKRLRKVKKLPKAIREKFQELEDTWRKNPNVAPRPNIDHWLKQVEQEHKDQKRIIQSMETQRRVYMNIADLNDVDRIKAQWESSRNGVPSRADRAQDWENAFMYQLFDEMRARIDKLPKTATEQISEWIYDESLSTGEVVGKTRNLLLTIHFLDESEGW